MTKKERTNYKRIMHYFWSAMMEYKMRTILIFALVTIWIFISNILEPYGVSEIIGRISAGDFEIENYIGIILFTVLPVAVNNLLVIRLVDWLDWSLDARCGKYLALLAFDAVINQSMTFHNNRFSGSLTSAANKLPSAFIRLKSNFIWDGYPLILTVIFSIVGAAFVCLPFALILGLCAIIYMVVAIVTYYKTSHVEAELADAENKQTGQLADSITNEGAVKSYAREKYERRRFNNVTDKTFAATMRVAKVSMFRNFSMNIVNLVTFISVIVLIIVSHNLFGLTIANVVFLYSLSTSLLSNLWTINHILRSFNQSFGDANEMVKILDLPYIIDDKTDKPLKIGNAEIKFDNIGFAHEKQMGKLFSEFSLDIRSGERVGLVGVSGSGKSTLTKLLLRFDDVKSGAIYIDGQDIRDVTQSSLREAIAYVPQESSLFHRSIFDNIAYGRPDATDEEVYEAARLANADEFIDELPDKYETMVGERGVKLSGGQRQRIAIARAILKDAPILVLDEATSALDSESEAAIQEALSNLMEGRTSIVVAHRLSTIAGLDRIVVLRDGKIVEQGSHKELLKLGKEYARLWGRQSGAFLDEE